MAMPITPMNSDKFRERFASKFEKRGPDECWPWTARSKNNGYGHLLVERRFINATHIAMMFDGRPRPDGAHALHSCDNKICVNPAHLRWGTNAENNREAVERGLIRRGSRVGGAKLSAEEVAAIRASREPQSTLAARYGVHPSTISYVKSGRSYKA